MRIGGILLFIDCIIVMGLKKGFKCGSKFTVYEKKCHVSSFLLRGLLSEHQFFFLPIWFYLVINIGNVIIVFYCLTWIPSVLTR